MPSILNQHLIILYTLLTLSLSMIYNDPLQAQPKIGVFNQVKVNKTSSKIMSSKKRSKANSTSVSSSTRKTSSRTFRLTQKKKPSSHQKRALIKGSKNQIKKAKKIRSISSSNFTSPFVRSRIQKASSKSKIQIPSRTQQSSINQTARPITRLKRNHHRPGQKNTEKPIQNPQKENRRQALKKQRKVAQNSSKSASNPSQSRSQSQSLRIRPRSTHWP